MQNSKAKRKSITYPINQTKNSINCLVLHLKSRVNKIYTWKYKQVNVLPFAAYIWFINTKYIFYAKLTNEPTILTITKNQIYRNLQFT